MAGLGHVSDTRCRSGRSTLARVDRGSGGTPMRTSGISSAVGVAVVGLVVAACDKAVDPPGTAAAATPAKAMGTAAGAPPAPTEEIADWTARLQKIAATYTNLSRVDDTSHWAPAACRAVSKPPQ